MQLSSLRVGARHQRTALTCCTAHQRAPVLAAWRQRSRRGAAVVVASVVWRQVEPGSAWVAHPRSARVRGVCHFLGGAFAGAAPQVLYNLFIELVADAGYTVVATPYQVTFQHLDCAQQVRSSFLDAVQHLRTQGRGYLVPVAAPTFGVGHSNGALLHLLIGAIHEQPVASNVVISYNNLQVGDAIPIPGLLDGLPDVVAAARSGPAPPVALPTPEQLLQGISSLLPAQLLRDRQLLAGAAPLLQQLGSVVSEVGEGITDFSPSPQESRALVGASYSVPSTLMVRFAEDSIDETPEMLRILQQPPQAQKQLQVMPMSDVEQAGASSNGNGSAGSPTSSSTASGGSSSNGGGNAAQWAGPRMVQELVLPGSHVTPCGSDVAWEAGPVFTPLDALAQGLKQGSQADVRRLAARVVEWLDAQAAAARTGGGGLA